MSKTERKKMRVAKKSPSCGCTGPYLRTFKVMPKHLFRAAHDHDFAIVSNSSGLPSK